MGVCGVEVSKWAEECEVRGAMDVRTLVLWCVNGHEWSRGRVYVRKYVCAYMHMSVKWPIIV